MANFRFCLLLCLSFHVLGQQYQLAILRGRVMDPESGLDAFRNLGIRDGRIVAITPDRIVAKTVVDAKGLVVAPGFIDLHSHGQTPESYRFKARDGVTTALELEVGAWPIPPWYAERTGKALVNFGASSGHIPASIAVMHDSGRLLPRDRAAERAPNAEEQREILQHIRQGLSEGGLGVG
ncbi:MAG: amidohydrolase family protein, partial [Bryobacteraceae bacterium]